VPSVMCNRLGFPNRTFSARACAPERLCRIELDGESNQQIDRGHKFEVLLGAPEQTSYKDHGSLCPNYLHDNYMFNRERPKCASNKQFSCAPRSPPTELVKPISALLECGVDELKWLFPSKKPPVCTPLWHGNPEVRLSSCKVQLC
jgi:hypothetical protein